MLGVIIGNVGIIKIKEMKNLWIISSAIGTKTSPNNTTNRWMQTVHTVESINARDENAEIHILDTGSMRLPEWSANLWADNVTFHDWSDEDGTKMCMINSEKVREGLTPKYLAMNPELSEEHVGNFLQFGYLKSVTESFAIIKFLKENDLSSYDRVYKISGRYFLTPKFDASKYDNRITMKIQGGPMGNRPETSISSVMWCFKGKHYEEFTYKLINVRQKLTDSWHKLGKLTDLETCLESEFLNDETVFIDWLGLGGLVNTNDGKPKFIGQ